MMKRAFGILSIILAFTGCKLIDEDLSGCPDEYTIKYEMRLVTNVQTEIETELSLVTEQHAAKALREYLKDIFSDFAHDVDLSFYDDQPPMEVLQHFTDIMDANQTEYTLHLPVRQYMHLAVANIVDNHLVGLSGEQQCHSSILKQTTPDGKSITPHNTGLFTARLPMDIIEGIDQQFKVNLYMANCATALVMDRSKAPALKGISAFTTGFAESFGIADSTYTFDSEFLVKADELAVEDGPFGCWVTVNFPSRDVKGPGPSPAPAAGKTPSTKVVIETTDPFIAASADESLWEWRVYVTLADDTVVETCLGLAKPLRAGQLKILKVRIDTDGRIIPDDATVATSVNMNWQAGPGGEVIL